MKLSNDYHQLGKAFYHQGIPTPVAEPVLLVWNEKLANSLVINLSPLHDSELLAQYFSGNKLLEGSLPLSQAYSGHQFGHFNPQLGDGRAHLLGENS